MFRDWLYGTPVSGLSSEKINVGVFNPEGVSSLLENDDIEIFVVLVQAPDKVRLIRSLNRESNPDVEEIIRRYSTDKKDFFDLENELPITIINLRNDRFEDIEANVEAIMRSSEAFFT